MKNKSRREFIRNSALIALGGALMPGTGISSGPVFNETVLPAEGIKFELPPLPYPYQALEPHIDKMTMEIHHDKHHLAYVNNLNKAIEGNAAIPTLEEILKKISNYPAAVRNNAGGHFNHSLFWKWMRPGGGGQPAGNLSDAINSSFGSFDGFRQKFLEFSMGRFGSGWSWLVLHNGKLEVGSTPNQDNPLMDLSDLKGKPILGLDVWEHAYYLKYRNQRSEYITAWWNIVNWETVTGLFTEK